MLLAHFPLTRARARPSSSANKQQPQPQQLHSGLVYEGVFHTLKAEKAGLSVVLKHARVVRDPALGDGGGNDAAAAAPSATLVLRASDLASVLAKDVRMAPEDLGPVGDADGAFATDSAISRGRGG